MADLIHIKVFENLPFCQFLAGWKWYAVLTWSCVLAAQIGEEEEEEEGRRRQSITVLTARRSAAIGTDECK